MAEADIHVSIILPNVTGLAKDEVETSFNYSCAAGVDSAGVANAILSFFNDTQLHETLAFYISPEISRTVPVRILYYDVTAHLDGSPHGTAFNEDTIMLGAASITKPLPSQCCGTLSYYSQLDAEGVTTPRHRGRMYLGPLNEDAMVTTGNTPHLASGFCDDATTAMDGLHTNLLAAANPKVLSVWTRRHSAFEAATTCFMENRIDTQRRRALDATTRTTQAL